MRNRRTVLPCAVLAGLPLTLPDLALALGPKDSVVLGIFLEPSPGLDPSGGAASSIGEVTLHNIFKALTMINA